MANAWSNWSGFVTASPKSIATPADAGELAELVRSAPGPLRVAGAGHSFTPLVPKAAAQLRIRLAQTQNVTVLAVMSNGDAYVAKKEVKVTIGGCGG